MEDDGVKAALVALDLVGLPRPIAESAREIISKTTGVPGANVMISATHSDTGPEMADGCAASHSTYNIAPKNISAVRNAGRDFRRVG